MIFLGALVALGALFVFGELAGLLRGRDDRSILDAINKSREAPTS